MLDKKKKNCKKLNHLRARKTFQLKLKGFFIIFEGLYGGEI